MKIERLLDKLEFYTSIDLLIIFDPTTIPGLFGGTYVSTECDISNISEVSVNGILWDDFLSHQKKLYYRILIEFNSLLKTSQIRDVTERSLLELRHRIIAIIKNFDRSFREPPFRTQAKSKNPEIKITYSDDILIAYLSECREIILSIVLEPFLDYTTLVSDQVNKCNSFEEFKVNLQTESTQSAKVGLIKVPISTNCAKNLYRLLVDSSLINDEFSEEDFLMIFVEGNLRTRIEWIGKKGDFHTFLKVLKERDIVVPHFTKGIEKCFILINEPNYFSNANWISSRFAENVPLGLKIKAVFQTQ